MENHGTENDEPHGEEKTMGNSADLPPQDEDEDEAEVPQLDMEFESEDAAKALYDAYAKCIGFSTRVGQYSLSNPDGAITAREFVCSREGLKRKNSEICHAVFNIERKVPGKWVVTNFVKEHNHSTVSPSKVHYLRPRRHFAGAAKTVSL